MVSRTYFRQIILCQSAKMAMLFFPGICLPASAHVVAARIDACGIFIRLERYMLFQPDFREY